MIEVDLDHQHADFLVTVEHGCGKEIPAFARGGAQPEEAPQLAVHRFAEIRAKGEVAADKAVLFVPVGGGEGVAVGIHQVHHLGARLGADVIEQLVGVAEDLRVFRVCQQRAQGRQFAEDLRQHFIAMQRAQQVGDVEIQGLAILPGQLAAVIALGQMLQRPQQGRQAQGQQGEAAPAGSARHGRGFDHVETTPQKYGAVYLRILAIRARCLALLGHAFAQRRVPVGLSDAPVGR